MAGVATQMTIRDGMTSKLNRIFQAVSRTNRALETTDALSDQVNPGANFDRAASAAGRASGQVDNFNNRQRQSEEGARKVASAWGLVKKAIGSALAAISVQKVIELADSMTSTRARLDIMIELSKKRTYIDNYNEYDTEAGFLSNFEADFRNAILDAVIRVAKNTVTDGGGYEDITRKVFLLSNTEVGLSNENSVAEGTLWSYFSSAARRQCYPTAEAVSNSEYTSSSLNASSYWWWWLRTPYASYANNARIVYTDGSLNYDSAYHGYNGVRPALYLESGNLVSDSTDTDGAYILQWNQPPSDPSSISYGTPQAGNSLVLSTGGSTDPEGDAISYVWERKIDSGAYVQLGITTAKTFTDTVPTSGTTYTARVKAVDANSLESGYCTG